jgi:hypothetical protein
MIDALRAVVLPKAANQPAPGRSPHLLSAIFFPTRPDQETG